MTPLSVLPRLLRVTAVLLRYHLDEWILAVHLFRPLRWFRMLLGRPTVAVQHLSYGKRLRLALIELGPLFVKAGQVLSTRRDLIPAAIADELALLQDRVPPFPGSLARTRVENELKTPINQLYARFDETPLASASIAQVHAATTCDGHEVVVKVLRPGIDTDIARNVKLLRSMGQLAQRWLADADRIRPLDMVAEVEKMLENELDLQREGANASLLRRNFACGTDLVVPRVYWALSSTGVLTMERMCGVSVDDMTAIDAAGIDRKALAAKGIRIFYEQVFRDNFFHADAHPGNIWVDIRHNQQPRFIILDCGIMGSLTDTDQYWLAQNFIALFERDYAHIARVHLEAGWMPASIRIDELEAAIRTVCEPYFSRPLAQISMAELVVKLFQTARRFKLTIQPQLILLQKTLLNIEGTGRGLDPQIDIWAVAHPILKRILRERYHPRRALVDLGRYLPKWLSLAPRLPEQLHEALQSVAHRQSHSLIDPMAQNRQHQLIRDMIKTISQVILGSTLLVSAALLWALAPGKGIAPPLVISLTGVLVFIWGTWRSPH